MTELVAYVGAVALVGAIGVVVGMIVARWMDRRVAPPPDSPDGELEHPASDPEVRR